jgi:indolepyruvate ferredoxin oxidoreductase
MAYKDEYEVARLYTSGDFERRIREQFDGDYELHFHLAPPLLAKRDEKTGQLRKREYGPWMFRGFKLLARLRSLRGTVFDVFGYTAERRMERSLIGEYEQLIDKLLAGLNAQNLGIAAQLLALPEKIRGFGHVKEKNLEDVRKEQATLLEKFSSPDASTRAAA